MVWHMSQPTKRHSIVIAILVIALSVHVVTPCARFVSLLTDRPDYALSEYSGPSEDYDPEENETEDLMLGSAPDMRALLKHLVSASYGLSEVTAQKVAISASSYPRCISPKAHLVYVLCRLVC